MNSLLQANTVQQLGELFHFPVLELEDNGVVVSIVNRKSVIPESFCRYIDSEPNVFSLFDFGHHSSIMAALKESHGFYVRKNPDPESSLNSGFYIKLPIYMIKIIPQPNGRFIGFVQSVEVLPELPFASSFLMFFSDVVKDTLIGFNRSFASRFGFSSKQYHQLLDKPLSDFLDPTPLTLQKKYFDKMQHLLRTSAKSEFIDQDFLDKISRWPVSDKAVLSLNSWLTSESDTHQLYTFAEYIDGSQNDFQFFLTTESSQGNGPIFLWGLEDEEAMNPENGYTVGPDGQRSRSIVKKKGFVCAQGTPYEVVSKEEWIFEKRGQLLTLQRNGKTVVSFFDFTMGEIGQTCLAFGIRAGYRFKIVNAALKIFPTLDHASAEESAMVRLRSSKEGNGILSIYPNYTLAIKWPHCMGFVLTDITPLEKKAELYRTRYVRARTLGDELTQLLAGNTDGSEAIIGSSTVIQSLREKIEPIAASEAAVLIEGDTGTGKEVLARTIHRKSLRGKEPFIKIDCSTFPKDLLESELFGHEKGAFTGAVQRKIGRFEQANGGTVFLDEVSNLPMTVQAKLLGVLQDLSIHRLGGTQTIPLDIRIITATNISMKELISSGRFREDLYYRISTVTFTLPPLRERHEDIPALTDYFLKQLGASQRGVVGLTAEAFIRLYAHSWPGNIRELRNTLHRALLYCTSDRIGAEHIQLDSLSDKPIVSEPLTASYKKRLPLRKGEVEQALIASLGNVRLASQKIGASRIACYDAMKRFGLDIENYRPRKIKKEG